MIPFDETFWWDIFITHFDETLLWDILMRHFDETFWWDILMRHFDETFWLDILVRHFDETFWWDIWMGYFDDILWWEIWVAGTCWNFVNNMPRLVIQLLNCTTGLSNLTQRVRHWLPWHCSSIFSCNVLFFAEGWRSETFYFMVFPCKKNRLFRKKEVLLGKKMTNLGAYVQIGMISDQGLIK